ncbi:MAG: sulfite exporter TauE/SafE family protein [Rhodobacteraceae bacterium]|nr:sulfite exporter TauE/SafE family protein [Paracoccaceae bacterium]
MQAALATEGLAWLALAVLVAGIVRGFSGFGSALVYLPIAGIFLPPTWVIATTMVFSIIGPLPLVPRAWAQAPMREVARLAIAGAVAVPLGVVLLIRLEPEAFRWLVSLVAVGTLGLLASGGRYRGEVSAIMGAGTGFLSGLMGGFIGLPGPPVILLYMSGQKAVAEIRAAILLFLFMIDVVVLATLLVRGLVTAEAAVIGLLLVPSYMLGGLIGQRLFNPARERLFRGVAYGIILLAAVAGLPIFD